MARLPSAPTTAPGIVDDSIGYNGRFAGILGDLYETVPDLLHPTSVQVYSQMRRDAQLTAILGALTLPVRRATWQISGAGCRPEVVALVADDLGLPVAGADDEPTGARVRGVKWRDHLRMALLRETYGYMPFAHRYEIRDGKARLMALAERMPQTWCDVTVDSDAQLVSAQQSLAIGQRASQPIPASQLTWHVRDREGANWWGTSVLRPSYAPWLLKREMQRVHATSNRRFGMGVPEYRPLPGTTPTPAQMAAAQAAVSSIRVGDQAGMVSIPGFQLLLNGITGSTPDTLAFIRWLDQQMSRTVLAGFLDLGETPNGSRALGAEFVDLFLLIEQTLAEDIAATETEQTVARIVEWNWGPDEPVPAVQVADVGSRREVTAEALQMLLTSGALSADPALEEWIRREYRLPARAEAEETPTSPIYAYDLQYQVATVNERRAQLGLPPVPGGDAFMQPPPAGQPQAAAGRRRPKKAAAAVDVPGNRRQPTLIEGAAGTDFDQVAATWADAVDQLVADWADITADQRQQVLDGIAAAVDDGEVDRLADLAVDSEAAAELLAERMHHLAGDAAAAMRQEAAGQGVTAPEVDPDTERLTELAVVFAALLAGSYAASATRKATQVWTAGADTDAVVAAVAAHLDSLTDGALRDGLGGAASAAQNEGRLAVLRSSPTATYYASEIHDANACKPCVEIDGHAFPDLAAAEAAYANGAYQGCLGGLRCRGIPIAVWNS